MSVMITLPESIEHHLKMEWGADLSRRALEALAIEGYRTEALSIGQVAEMLGMSVNDADGFLKERGVDSLITIEDFKQGRGSLANLFAQ
jgi:predicted HTH domain antitoxin